MTKNSRLALKNSFITGIIFFMFSLIVIILEYPDSLEQVSYKFLFFIITIPALLAYLLKFKKLQWKDEIENAKTHGIDSLLINYRKEGIKYALYVACIIFSIYLLIAIDVGVYKFILELKKDYLYLGGGFYFGFPMILAYTTRICFLKNKLKMLQYFHENPQATQYTNGNASSYNGSDYNHHVSGRHSNYLTDNAYYYTNYYMSHDISRR